LKEKNKSLQDYVDKLGNASVNYSNYAFPRDIKKKIHAIESINLSEDQEYITDTFLRSGVQTERNKKNPSYNLMRNF
jgi:hypothetical protein